VARKLGSINLDDHREEIERRLADGQKKSDISRELGIPYQSITSAIERWRLKRAESGENPWWTDPKRLSDELERHGSAMAISRHYGGTPSYPTIRAWMAKLGITRRHEQLDDDGIDEIVVAKLRSASRSVEELADAAGVPPKEIRDSIQRLSDGGWRIRDCPVEPGKLMIQRVAPDSQETHTGSAQDGVIRFGVVSDTHLCSREHAAEQLEAAYDRFAAEGVTEVLHAGDLVAGRGIYKTQDSDITHHTFHDQVSHAVSVYPARRGIKTRVISGNHDVEGDFGRIGADPVAAVASQRDDIDFLGSYSAWIDYGPSPSDGASTLIHLLHGRGSMSYAYSYRAQKLVEGYAHNRKPVMLIAGHWHVSGHIPYRGVSVLFPGCFEWQTSLLTRIGLTPSVGYYIVELDVRGDGGCIGVTPRWHQFKEHR